MTALNLDSGAQASQTPIVDQQHISSQTFKFEIPEHYRDFLPFARLPPEIRAQIWQNTLDTPGIHFLKITPETGIRRWWMKESYHPAASEDEETDPMTLEVKNEKLQPPMPPMQAILEPLCPTQADISHYTTLHKQIAKLTVTCNESASIARSLVNRSTAFRLHSGRLVSLNRSDVIYLEYLPSDCYENEICFTKALNCPGLDQIRKVAMRYCHKWNERKVQQRCPHCGQLHDVPGNLTYPKHLYRFLAQYLPNLEEFYFVDYLILPKSQTAAGADATVVARGTSKFEGGNRSFFEVDDEQNWKISSRVLDCKSWLQGQFIKYAKASILSKHKRPEKVKFGVLACQWRIEPPVAPVNKKGRNKKRPRKLPRGPSLPIALPYEVTVRYPFVFDACGSNIYAFTFSMTL